MRKFHIIYKENKEDYFCRPHTEDATDELQAIKQYREKFPNAIFVTMYDLNVHVEYPFVSEARV